MTLLFKKGTAIEKLSYILELTYNHAKNLGLYVFFYKMIFGFLNKIRRYDKKHAIIAGFISAYCVFKKKSAVNT